MKGLRAIIGIIIAVFVLRFFSLFLGQGNTLPIADIALKALIFTLACSCLLIIVWISLGIWARNVKTKSEK
jgi:hypothetical protein